MSRWGVVGVGLVTMTVAIILGHLWGAAEAAATSPPSALDLAPSTLGYQPADNNIPDDKANFILLNAGPLNTTTEAAKAQRQAVGDFKGQRMHLVHFAGPVQPAWYAELEKTGVQIISYLAHHAYLVYGDAASLERLQAWALAAPYVQWDGVYQDDYRIQPSALAGAGKDEAANNPTLYQIQMVTDPVANHQTLALVAQYQQGPILQYYSILHYTNFYVALPTQGVQALARQPDVVSIRQRIVPQKMDERQNRIISGQLTGNGPTPGNYLTWLASKGIGPGTFDFAVDVTDSGIDNASTSPNHFGLWAGGLLGGTSRVIYNRLVGTPHQNSTLEGCDGHGTINAHIVGGYVPDALIAGGFPHADALGFRYGLGVAPYVKLGSSVIFDPTTFTNPSYPDLQSRAYQSGARISTNSWGANTGGDYGPDDQAYDALTRDAQPASAAIPQVGNQPMVMVFAAGNAGPGLNTVGSPGGAKNVITVGASEGVQPFGGPDWCNVSDTSADSANDIVGFSSRGPTDDGRNKPDLVAPGTHITGGVFQYSSAPPATGQAAVCFNGNGVCGGPSSSLFFPLGQQWYTASSGTSHSTPAVAGAAALVRQAFLNQSFAAPSPAMTKAALMATARYMTGAAANDTLWSNSQGMGMLNLDTFFDLFTTPSILRDQVGADTFTASGQIRTITGNISHPGKPFRVTLAWTDAPGPTTGAAYVNDLDLEVIVGGQLYKGNVFSGAHSTTGGARDYRNNVESVFLPAGVSGPFLVRVKAANIAGDGIPNVAPALDQDYALVIYNGLQAPHTFIEVTGLALTLESCAPVNGALDPGETVTVNVTLQNVGTLNATDLTATLQATGGVLAPSQPQNYGALAVNAAASRTFAWTVDAALLCGGQLVGTLQLQDGPTNLGTAQFGMTLGVQTAIFAESFDAVTAPALPVGWTASVSGAGATTAWRTSTTNPDTAPNAVFAPNPSNVSDNVLHTPPILINSAAAKLIFRHRYDTEASGSNPTFGYDGGVLEIQIGGGAFQDILTAGGSFAQNGYNRLLSSCCSNPLGGRQAWSGDSLAYITTVVNLPAAANGQSVVLRWRLGTDNTVVDTGWWVDGISILGAYQCCGEPTPEPSPTRTATASPTATSTSTATATRTATPPPSTTSTRTPTSPPPHTPTITVTPSHTATTPETPTPSLTPTGSTPTVTHTALATLTGTATITPTHTLTPSLTPVGPTPSVTRTATATVTEVATVTHTPTPTRTLTPTVTRTPTPPAQITRPGLYRGGDWFLRNSLTSGPADLVFNYGLATDVPLMCDWDGDGTRTVGVYRPSNSAFYLRNTNTGGFADMAIIYGTASDVPVCGDWNGDGVQTVGIFRPSTAALYLRNSNTSGPADLVFLYGIPGDIFVSGDWNGDGIDTVGIRRGGTWFLKNTNGNGDADLVFGYGLVSDVPMVGDWDNNGTDTPGVYRNGVWYIRNSNTAGSADLSFNYGIAGDKPLVWR